MPDKETQTPWTYDPDNYDYRLDDRPELTGLDDRPEQPNGESPPLDEEDFQYGDGNALPQSNPVAPVAATEGWGDENAAHTTLIEFLLNLYEMVYPMVIASFTFQYDDKATQTPWPHMPNAEDDSNNDYFFE